MIVVDTNILAYLYLPTTYSKAAENLLNADPEWVAPTLWRSEFRNILAGSIRRNMLTLKEAQTLQANAEDLMHESEYDSNSDAVLALVEASNCSAYDCEFVALARELNVPLVTMDKQIRMAFPEHARGL